MTPVCLYLTNICICFDFAAGGELFAKRRKRAENWVVDETSVGQSKPSAFADKFMQVIDSFIQRESNSLQDLETKAKASRPRKTPYYN
jgi:hypothetical protein